MVVRIGVAFVGIAPWAPGSQALAHLTDACCRFAPRS